MHSDQIQQLRDETPGTRHHIHLNNAGAALMPDKVLEAIQEHLAAEHAHGGYEAAASAKKRLQGFYSSVARVIGAQPHQIAYAASATDAYSRVLTAIPWQKGDRILTTYDDYVSNQLAFFQLRKRFGVDIHYAGTLPEGGVDPQSMRKHALTLQPKLIAVTHMPTNSGLIQDVKTIGDFAREHNILYLVDGCQTAGQLEINVEDIGCDFFSATFRKYLRGPRGTGFLYVSDRVLDTDLHPLFIDLHSATWSKDDDYDIARTARRFELWERPYAMMLGAKAAADYALNIGLPAIEKRVIELAGRLRTALENLDHIHVLDQGKHRGGIVTLHIPGQDPRRLKVRLNQATINCSLTFFESARLDFKQKGAPWVLRLSPHYYNTHDELDQVVEVLQTITSS